LVIDWNCKWWGKNKWTCYKIENY